MLPNLQSYTPQGLALHHKCGQSKGIAAMEQARKTDGGCFKVGEPNLMKIRLQCCLGLSGNKASLVSSFGFIVIFGVMAEAKLFEIDWINSAILLRPWFLAFWTASKNGFSSLSSMTLENCSSLFGFASPISIKMLENSFLLIQSGSNLTSLRKIGLDVVDETCSWKAW
ncbi:hypothetical protein Tco_0871682 [Tanacetum coccineum]